MWTSRLSSFNIAQHVGCRYVPYQQKHLGNRERNFMSVSQNTRISIYCPRSAVQECSTYQVKDSSKERGDRCKKVMMNMNTRQETVTMQRDLVRENMSHSDFVR